MTKRDRLMLLSIAAIAVLAAGWMLGVSPERKKAAKLETEVSSAQSTLATAQSQLAEAQGAQAQYATAYASVVKLGKAVPAQEQVPSLVYELDQATHQKDVEFTSIAVGSSGSSASSGTGASALGAAASGGFTQMPFTFIFHGTFKDLYNLLNQVDGFTLNTTSGVQVTGRLLTIQGANLELSQENKSEGSAANGKGAAAGSSSKGSTAKNGEEPLTGTITATAYVLPPGQGLTAGATPAGPAGTSATPASGSSPTSSNSSPAAPAVVKVTP